MLESRERLGGEVASLLGILRELADARYACLLEPERLLLESPAPLSEPDPLLSLITTRRERLFALPGRMSAGEPLGDDLFEELEEEAFLLVVVNGRVALLLACPGAQTAEERIAQPLRTLVDRLLRFEPTYRGRRGLFLGSPRLEFVRIERAGGAGSDAEHL